MTLPIAIVLSILVLAFIFFVTGWLRPDMTALLVLLSLVFTGVISAQESFQGFSSYAVMAIAGLLIIGEGLERTGVVRWVARQLEKVTGQSFNRALLVNTAVPGLLSGFVNIVAAASFFIPVILRLSLKMNISPSRLLMPMASIALIGANLTLIGASHNLVVHSLLEESQGVGFGFFEFTVVGAVLLAVGLIYIFFIGRYLLPDKKKLEEPKDATASANLIEDYGLDEKLFEVWISEEFEERDLKFKEIQVGRTYGIELVEIVREGSDFIEEKDYILQSGDTLLLKGDKSKVEKFCHDYPGITFMGAPESQEEYPISTAELAEAVVPPRSSFIGKTPRELNFQKDYRLKVIAYYRKDAEKGSFSQDVELQEGDGLLFYGPRQQIRDFEPDKNILIYHKPGKPDISAKQKKMAPWAALILFAVIALAAADVVSIAVSALAGAAVMVLIGIINPLKTYDAIDWKTIVLIGGMYPLGIALNQTGAADLIGDTLINTLGEFGPLAVMAGVVVLTMILTQPIHNAAVAIIMTPIAINAAELMEANPRAFCVAVLIACSTTFMMPVGHPAPLMVQDPGNYKTVDYMKFGIPLNVLAIAVILLVVPIFWPL